MTFFVICMFFCACLWKVCSTLLAAFVLDEFSKQVETVNKQMDQWGNQQHYSKEPKDPEPGLIVPIHVGVNSTTNSQTGDHVEEECVDKQENQWLIDVQNSGFFGANKNVADNVDSAENLHEDTGGIGIWKQILPCNDYFGYFFYQITNQ